MSVDIASLAIRIDSSETESATQNLNQMRQAGGQAEQSTARLEAAARKLTDVLKLLGAAIGANELIKQADLWASLEGRLRLVTNTERQMIGVRQQLYDMSQRTRGELEGTVDLYTKLTRSTQSLGTTEAQRLRVTDSINKMMVISSATSEEAANAIRQLGQAMGSGVLRGDELNRILESAPRLAEAIAAGMGRSADEVRAMGAAGEITSKALIDSLLTQSQAIDDEFGKMPKVVSQAMVQIQNSFLRTVGVFDQTNQLSANLADTLSLVAENMGVLVAGAAGLAATGALHWVGGMVVALRTKIAVTTAAIAADRVAAATTLAAAITRVAETAATVAATTARLAEVRAATLAATGNVQLALTTNALIPAQQRAAAAALAHAAALKAQSVAGAGAAGVAGWGARAMGLLGGPIGIVTTLLGLGATAWMMWGQKAEKTQTDVKATLAETTEEILIDLDKQIKKLAERNRLMGVAPALAKAEGPGAEQQRAIMAEINRIAKDETIIAAAKTEQLRLLGGQYNALTVKMELAAKGQAELDTALKGDKRAKWLLDNSQYMSEAQKLAAAIAKAKADLGDAYTKADEAMITAKFDDGKVKKAAKSFDDARKSAQDYIASLKIEGEELGASESQLRKMHAAREAAKAPTLELKREILAAADALDTMHLAHDALTKSQERAKKGAEDMEKIFEKHRDSVAKSIEDAEKEAEKNEELARTFGMTKGAIEQLELARLEGQLAQRASTGLTLDEIETLEKLIDAKQRSVAALGKVDELEVAKKINDDLIADGKRMAESIGGALSDNLMRGGKTGAEYIKDLFRTMILRPIVAAVVNPVAGLVTGAMGVSGAANAASGASSIGSAGGVLSGIGAMSGAFGGGIASGLSAWGAGGSVTGLLGSGALFGGGIANGLGLIAGALGPIALGIGAAVAIWKKFDTSGTYHTGGASSASAAGTRTIRAESLGFEGTRINAETEKLTANLASGIVGILDSTATAFGKTAGYTAATAFADDTSKDGAWGALMISKLGQTVVDWDSTRTSRWAPKEFADGEAGQAQYLAALSASVRTALNDIGLPGWAQAMLDGLGQGASIEEIAKVVDGINATKRALVVMGNSLTGFAQLSDRATSALIAASGGIDALAGNASVYYDAFYSEAEKTANVVKQITEVLTAAGVAMPATDDAFREQVEAQMALGEAGAPAVAALLKVAGAFAQTTESAKKAAADITSQRVDLLNKLDQLTMTSAQLRAKERLTIDASNRALFDQINARQDIAAAYGRESSAMKTLADNMKSAQASTIAYKDSLSLGNLSILTPIQKAMEAQRQYEASVAKARANPTDGAAYSASQTAATAWLTASQIINASSDAQVANVAKVQADMSILADIAGAQLTDAQMQMVALDKQVEGILTLNQTAIGIEEAIRNLGAAGGQPSLDPQFPQPTLTWSAMGTPGMAPLVAAIKSLREEVKGLRADQHEQTGDIINNTHAAAGNNAKEVSAGAANAAKSTSWQQDLRTGAQPV